VETGCAVERVHREVGGHATTDTDTKKPTLTALVPYE
jgi:hypothetical protein